MKKMSTKEYEQCHDAFYKQMVALTDSGTVINAKIETAWQLKRIADSLEFLAADGILVWNAGNPG